MATKKKTAKAAPARHKAKGKKAAGKKPAVKAAKKVTRKAAPKKKTVSKPFTKAKKAVAKKSAAGKHRPVSKKAAAKAKKPVKKATPAKKKKGIVKKVVKAIRKAVLPKKAVRKPASVKAIAKKPVKDSGPQKASLKKPVSGRTTGKVQRATKKTSTTRAVKPAPKPAPAARVNMKSEEKKVTGAKPTSKTATTNKSTTTSVNQAAKTITHVTAPKPQAVPKAPEMQKKPASTQPKETASAGPERTRYTDEELVEFRGIIMKKLEEAKKDLDLLMESLSNKDNGTDDTSPTFKLLEDGSDVLTKEETAQLAARQQRFIQNLENALIRIENKTYGICRATGKLISKERLRVVPHATLSIEAKKAQ